MRWRLPNRTSLCDSRLGGAGFSGAFGLALSRADCVSSGLAPLVLSRAGNSVHAVGVCLVFVLRAMTQLDPWIVANIHRRRKFGQLSGGLSTARADRPFASRRTVGRLSLDGRSLPCLVCGSLPGFCPAEARCVAARPS